MEYENNITEATGNSELHCELEEHSTNLITRHTEVQTEVNFENFLEVENFYLKKQLVEMKKENLKYLESLRRLVNKSIKMDKLFTPRQIKKIESSARVTWTTEDIFKAISLYTAGPKAYRMLLQRNFPFPSVSTLKKWTQKFKKLGKKRP